jgi:hypothetical protein
MKICSSTRTLKLTVPWEAFFYLKILSKIKKMINTILEKIEILIMSKLLNLIRSIRRKIRRNRQLRIWLISGTELHSGEHFTIFYAGEIRNKNYIVNLVFGDQYDEIDLGKQWLHNVFRIAKQNIQDCSMMVIEVPERLHKLLKRKKDFYIPLWVRGEVDIPLTVSNRSVKSDLRKIRKNNLELEVTTEKSQFDKFYNDMYLPYMNHRHGIRNVAENYDGLMRYWESGTCELLLIKKKNEHIGGQLLVYEENCPRLLVLGIKDGNPCYLKCGAGAAGYYLASSYLAEQGHRSVHLGSSRPFLKDGVLQFKKRRGLRLTTKTKKGFLVKPLSPSNGLKGFFLRNPFIYYHRRGLYAAIFVEEDEVCSCDESLEDLCENFYLNGLSKVNIYPLKVNESNPKRSVPPAFSDRIKILSADHIFAPALR